MVGVLILKQSSGPDSRSRSTLTLHSGDQSGWFGGVLAEPHRHLVDQQRNNSWDHELQISQCVWYMLDYFIDSYTRSTQVGNHIQEKCHCLSTYCRWFLNEGLSQALVCSWSIVVRLSNSSYIKHSLWALCDLYVNVEGWRIVFNQLCTVFIPDTGRVHSLFIKKTKNKKTANLPICTASRITVLYVFNLGKGPCANESRRKYSEKGGWLFVFCFGRRICLYFIYLFHEVIRQ